MELEALISAESLEPIDPMMDLFSPPLPEYAAKREQISKDTAKEIVGKCEATLKKLQERREGVEKEWSKVLKGLATGELLEPQVATRAATFTQTADVTYPALFQQALSEKLNLLKQDFFVLEPKLAARNEGIDTIGAIYLTEFVRQKLENECSTFYESFRLAITQAASLNLGIIGYEWIVRESRGSSPVMVNGQLKYPKDTYKTKIDYQGARAKFIDLFNFYFDDRGYFSNLYDLDCYVLSPIKPSKYGEGGMYDPKTTYYNEDLVLYRNFADEEAKGWNRSQDLNNIGREKSEKNDERQSTLVQCWIDELELKDESGKKQRFENICVHYLRESKTPLLVEVNRLPFHRKPFVFITHRVLPNDLYSMSQVQLAYSAFARSAFYKTAGTLAVSNVLLGTICIPTELTKSVKGETPESIKKAIFEGNKIIHYDSNPESDNGYVHQPTSFFSPVAEQSGIVLPVLQQFQLTAQQDIQTALVDLQSIDAAESTATGVKATAAKRDLLQADFADRIAVGLKRFISLFLDDLKVFLSPEEIRINPNRMSVLSESGSQVDRVKWETISATLLADYETEIAIRIEGHDLLLGEKMEMLKYMSELAQSSPDRAASEVLGEAILEMGIQILKVPNGVKILEKYREALEIAKQQAQQQAEMQKAEMRKTLAAAEQTSANARKQNAEAAEKEQEQAATAQFMAGLEEIPVS